MAWYNDQTFKNAFFEVLTDAGVLEDMEDANDILRAEKKATGFTTYERFRQRWLKS